MRRILVAVTLGALMLAPMFTPSATADDYYGGHGGEWFFGAGFRVGGFHFSIGFAEPRYGHEPVYYYRASPRLAYRGHRCHDRCFRHESYAYHHRDCPLVRHHFGRHRVEPRHVLARYAPRHGYYDRGYYDRDHRGRSYDRHDRRDRYDRHDRYDRRHRDDDRWQNRRGRHRGRGHDHRDRHRGRRGHDHRDHRGGSCPYDR